jgi:dipeptidyl-peptidase III
LKSNPLYNDELAFYRQVIDELWPQVKKEVFAMEKPYTQLGFPEKGGVTGYFSRGMTDADLALVKEFLLDQKIDILITRAFKEHGGYTITVGSADKHTKEVEFKDHKFKVEYGEFSSFLAECNMYLSEALKYAANDTQKRMLEHYISSFKTGSIEDHKNSQREWVKDKGPVVETNIGYIESYVDPENARAYWEGLVAIVDKEKSKKFGELVKNSETIIPQLPWEPRMEKEKFLAPDFTTLEVICFASNGCPAGINIPNYDDIREKEGFKNVYLGNAMGSPKLSNILFAKEEDAKVICDNVVRVYELHVGCHELLGHGTGRLIYRTEDG